MALLFTRHGEGDDDAWKAHHAVIKAWDLVVARVHDTDLLCVEWAGLKM